MKITTTVPSQDRFRMPAEYEPHRGCILIWPVRPGSWPHQAKEAQQTFTVLARAIAESEKVWLLTDEECFQTVCGIFSGDANIEVVKLPTNDAWARDIGPTCVVNDRGDVRGVSWKFNAWGGSFDGLYADWELDDAATAGICTQLGIDYYDAGHFVLEGGSIHSDGEGTVLVTEACLLSEGRNPKMSREEIEQELKKYLGAQKVIWLPRGIYQDETNEHVDNVCAFTGPAEVVLAWTEDEEDPQYALSMASYRVLEAETDAKGRSFQIHKLLIPKEPVCITKEELSGFVFEEGEDQRQEGERLAASYVNFYISNGAVLVPQFGDVNDAAAVQLLEELFPCRKIIPIAARPIIVGGGNIHCITQQIPR